MYKVIEEASYSSNKFSYNFVWNSYNSDNYSYTFDFKEEYAPSSDWEHERYNQSGVIAEEVLDIYPTLVRYSNYEEPDKPAIPTFVEYSHFVPYLIKMVQMQQKEIDNLKEIIGHNP